MQGLKLVLITLQKLSLWNGLLHGIRVNALAPTAVNTPSRQVTLQGPILEKVLSRIPLGRLATPEDLLGAVIYFSSEASDFVTGQTLFIDGGWVAAS
ncbi:MAG: SDR family oxidoreductase [Desulfobacterales bacterium]|nr:SDR family oxidoreductase [Desulfobacterales bacterium]